MHKLQVLKELRLLFWSTGNQPGGSSLSWATDQSVSMGHSLKISKTATSDTASWVSDNMCDIWSPTVTPNVDLLFGALGQKHKM